MERGHGREGDPPPAPEPLPVEVTDAHCHLDLMAGGRTADTDDGTADDLAAAADAVAVAQSVGVRRVVTVGVDVPTSRWSAAVATRLADVYAAVAIHPNDAGLADDVALAEIARLAALPRVRAVGETGLDHFRTPEDGWRAQEDAFRRHIAIARASGKALVIHDRDAHDDVLRVLREEGAPEHTVFHCFSGDAAMARVCADAGYVMSFAGNVTFKNAEDLRAALRVAPADLLLVETDAPFLTPVPYRGRPNAPYLVPVTMRAMAAVREVPVEALATTVAANAERVFGPW